MEGPSQTKPCPWAQFLVPTCRSEETLTVGKRLHTTKVDSKVHHTSSAHSMHQNRDGTPWWSMWPRKNASKTFLVSYDVCRTLQQGLAQI